MGTYDGGCYGHGETKEIKEVKTIEQIMQNLAKEVGQTKQTFFSNLIPGYRRYTNIRI